MGTVPLTVYFRKACFVSVKNAAEPLLCGIDIELFVADIAVDAFAHFANRNADFRVDTSSRFYVVKAIVALGDCLDIWV